MNIPLVDLKAEYLSIKDEIDEAIQRVIDNSSFILGEEVEKFEENFAKYIGVKHCIGVSSCTAALHLALEIFNNEKVLVPIKTVTADIEAVFLAKYSHIGFYSKNLKVYNNNLKTIIVHLYGIPDIGVGELSNKCIVIEDCAQATGAEINGQKCGTFGDLGCFSFFPSKVLGCYGDGGAVCTDNDDYARVIRAMRNHGRLPGKKHIHDMVGFNYRLDGLQAAILNAKLPHLDEWIEKRRQVAQWYWKYLREFEDNGFLELPREPNDAKAVYYVYAIECDNRTKLREYLIENGIHTGIHYPVPLHKQPAYDTGQSFPEAEKWAERTLSLPMHPFLEEETVEYICGKIKSFYENH